MSFTEEIREKSSQSQDCSMVAKFPSYFAMFDDIQIDSKIYHFVLFRYNC